MARVGRMTPTPIAVRLAWYSPKEWRSAQGLMAKAPSTLPCNTVARMAIWHLDLPTHKPCRILARHDTRLSRPSSSRSVLRSCAPPGQKVLEALTFRGLRAVTKASSTESRL